MVAIIDYGMGNVASVQKALNFLNIKNEITHDHYIIRESNSIILPGVGSFAQGMKNLEQRDLTNLLKDQVLNIKKPIFGICLGMQLLFEKGIEPHECKGLGFLKGEVKKFDLKGLNIPHLGWNNIDVFNKTYYTDINKYDFYFIHSYFVVPTNLEDIAATVNYGFDVVASVQKENIFATQFHPEKSQSAGLAILKRFFDKNA